MFALGFFGWLFFIVVAAMVLIIAAVKGGLFAKPVAPKVPERVVAGTAIRIEDGGSPRLMLALHPLQFQVSIWRNGKWLLIAESKETKRHHWDWVIPPHLAGERLRFTATNECPVSDWDTAAGPGTERVVCA